MTRRKEEFLPMEEGKVKMYSCGITVSGNAHIGHLFQALIYDLVRKVLEKNGYQVKYARNYTDIDDKIIAKANELKVDANEYALKMIKKIDEEMAYFQVDEPTMWLKATENVDNIIQFVSKLIDKGYAYRTEDGTVYFRTHKFEDYGKLSHKNIDDLEAGHRNINVTGEQKEDYLDFVLWKPKKEGEP